LFHKNDIKFKIFNLNYSENNIIVNNNDSSLSNNSKKPPHHLQPIENFDDSEANINHQKQQFAILSDLYHSGLADRKISIPLTTNVFKDKDHINLDINLKLVDFLPNANRSFDDFEVNNDPLSKHIRRFESMSRSLPGSSGSLNKSKPLPPVSNKKTTQIQNQNSFNQDTRLQHEFEMTNDTRTDG
jgi:hypothetical protein